jgi:hypothetical protein
MADSKIVDMARGPDDYSPEEYATNPYPCGLRLTLDLVELRKLGIEELPPLGSQIAFYVCGEVCRTSESIEYGVDKCMSVQIQQMALEELPDEEAKEDAAERYSKNANKLYGKG